MAYERLSALDRSFLDLEDHSSHMHVAGCFVFEKGPLATPEGGIDIDKIRDSVAATLHRIPRYRQRIEWIPFEQHPVWVDCTRFNIEYHVRHLSLPAPGDDRQLKRLCGRIMSQQLDRGKPLWEFWFVEGLSQDRFALVSKAHHCMIDGVSGVELMAAILSPTAEKELEPGPQFVPSPTPSKLRLLRDAALRRVGLPFALAGQAQGALRQPRTTWTRARETLTSVVDTFSSALYPALDTPLNQPIGPHRRFDWIAFDLDEVKRVKNVLGGTVNDVVLATATGALGRFLVQRGMTRAAMGRRPFRAFCPVSVRHEDEQGALGNRVSSMIVPLPVAETDPVRRLTRISAETRDLKSSKQALGAEALTSVSEWLAPTLITQAARLGFGGHASNVVITNVPGPQLPIYLLGARMLESYPMVPLFQDQGVGIALFSYAGGLYWGISADWDRFPDLHDLVLAIDASFRELCEAADALEP